MYRVLSRVSNIRSAQVIISYHIDALLILLTLGIILRDVWLLNVISILFELMEYSLETQLPNFAECWWDHVSSVYSFLCTKHFMKVM